MYMKKAIRSGKVIGPYSPGIIAQGTKWVFISGQIADDLEADVSEQTRQVLTKIQIILSQANGDLKNVVKCMVFLADMSDFSPMNDVYAEFFPDTPPARAAFQVAKLPRGARIEIEATAVLDE